MNQLSREFPSEEPSFFPTPITWHGTLFHRISFPRGSTEGRRFSSRSIPITQTGAELLRAASVVCRPATRATSYISAIGGVQERRLVSFWEFGPRFYTTRPPLAR